MIPKSLSDRQYDDSGALRGITVKADAEPAGGAEAAVRNDFSRGRGNSAEAGRIMGNTFVTMLVMMRRLLCNSA